MNLVHTSLPSPVGELLLVGQAAPSGTVAHLTRLTFAEPTGPAPDWVAGRDHAADRAGERNDAAFAEVAQALEAYFDGRATDIPVAAEPEGTEFQRRVWAALRDIPYGATSTYGAIAKAIGSPGAVRAVGLAVGRNPISLVIPCHRVVGADGSLTGYAGGLDHKRFLLSLEAQGERGEHATGAPILER